MSESLHAIASLQERERTLGEESRFYQVNTVGYLLYSSPLLGAADQDSVNLDSDSGFLTKKSIYRYFYAVLRILIRIRLPVTDPDPDPTTYFFPVMDPLMLQNDPLRLLPFMRIRILILPLRWCGSGSTTLLL